MSATGPAPAGPARLRLAAPAKVNLGLRVLGRRDDGYHLLESLFVPLDLADWLELAPAPGARGIRLRVHGPRAGGVPTDATNLAVRAAAAFHEAAGLGTPGLELVLEKHVPAQAGLGGGSSDAGAVLRGLARLHPGALAPEALAALALRLGADVPFFLAPGPARVGGIGERITALGDVAPLHLLLVHPGVGLATGEVYAAHDALSGARPAALTAPEAGPSLSPPSPSLSREALARHLGALLANDLEPAALRLCPPLARLRRRIADLGALAVGMSGSGPTLFGVFPDAASAREAAERAGFAPPVWCRVARTLAAEEAGAWDGPGAPGAGTTETGSRSDGASPNW